MKQRELRILELTNWAVNHNIKNRPMIEGKAKEQYHLTDSLARKYSEEVMKRLEKQGIRIMDSLGIVVEFKTAGGKEIK